MATLTALCRDEATVVLCSRFRDQGFDVSWLYMDDPRRGRIEPEALASAEPPDGILRDLDEPVDESMLLLTLFDPHTTARSDAGARDYRGGAAGQPRTRRGGV